MVLPLHVFENLKNLIFFVIKNEFLLNGEEFSDGFLYLSYVKKIFLIYKS